MNHNNQYHISDLTASALATHVQRGLEAVRDHLTRASEDAEAVKDALTNTYRFLSTDQRISGIGEAVEVRLKGAMALLEIVQSVLVFAQSGQFREMDIEAYHDGIEM